LDGISKLELDLIFTKIVEMPIGLWVVVGVFALLLLLALVRKLFKVGCLILIIILAVFGIAQLI